MDFRRYQKLRTYCTKELHEYLNMDGYEEVMRFWVKQNPATGRIMREQQMAFELHQCIDLTPRESAAALLLHEISKHAKKDIERMPNQVNGREPLPMLTATEINELNKNTNYAVRGFAAFLPEAECAVLLNECEVDASLLNAKTPAPGDESNVPTKRITKKPSIESVALVYMRKEYRTAQFQSAAKFHKHLIKTAGTDDSPFVKGTGINAGKLFCPAASSFYDAGTLGKTWSKIRAN